MVTTEVPAIPGHLRLHQGAALLVAVLAACNGDQILRNEGGCWTSGHQAYQATLARKCDYRCYPEDDFVDSREDGEQQCLETLGPNETQHRNEWCFDGCAVDACLAAWDHYLTTCTDGARDAWWEQCYGEEPVFWDASSTTRTYTEECVGW